MARGLKRSSAPVDVASVIGQTRFRHGDQAKVEATFGWPVSWLLSTYKDKNCEPEGKLADAMERLAASERGYSSFSWSEDEPNIVAEAMMRTDPDKAQEVAKLVMIMASRRTLLKPIKARRSA